MVSEVKKSKLISTKIITGSQEEADKLLELQLEKAIPGLSVERFKPEEFAAIGTQGDINGFVILAKFYNISCRVEAQ